MNVGSSHAEERGIDVDLDREPVEARLLDLEVRPDVIELLGERRDVARRFRFLRKKLERWTSSSRARSASVRVIAMIVLSELNRKCGFTCACTSFSSDMTSRFCVW